jgi:tight adherence protein C
MGILLHIKGVKYRRGMIEKIQANDSESNFFETDGSPLKFYGKSGNFFMNFMSFIGIRTNPNSSTNDVGIKLKFLKAGLRGRNVPTVFWGSKVFLSILFPLSFLFIAVIFIKAMSSLHMLTTACFLVILGLYLPDIWLHFKTTRRREKIVKGFPDALDLLVVCMEAGMGLNAAIHKVGEELGLTHPELSEEFKFLNLELRAGKARPAALRNLAKRTDIEDVKSLVTLLIQTDRFGTSVGQALRVYSDSFRTARFQKAEEIAAKMSTKLIFPLVLFIFPSFFVVAVGPAIIQIFRALGKI